MMLLFIVHLVFRMDRLQVKSLKQKLEQQDAIAQKTSKEAKEAAFVAAQESAKFNAAVELIRTIETQVSSTFMRFYQLCLPHKLH